MQERFKDWEASGVKVVPVLSQPGSDWNGAQGYVQVFSNFHSSDSPMLFSLQEARKVHVEEGFSLGFMTTWE